MVLPLVLVVIALLTLTCFTFAQLMLAERRAADLSGKQAQARALADSGVEMIRMFLAKDKETQDDAGGWYDNQNQLSGFRGRLVQLLGDAEIQDPRRFTVVAPRVEDGIMEGIRFGLEDESTRLNLNTLLAADDYAENGGREILMGLPGMTEEVADAILDWIDEDEDPREYGAEIEYYSSLDPPYAPKNGPLETVEELLLVRGVTPWLMFGCDANRNGLIDPGEPDPQGIADVDNSDGSLSRGWSAYLTLYSKELNLTPDGEPRIDLNQEDMEELYDQLEEKIGAEWATFIVALRQNGPYTGSRPGEIVIGRDLDLSQKGTHTFTRVLDLIGPKVRVTFEGDEQPTVVETPFPDVPGVMNLYLPILMDYCCAGNTDPVIHGRISINQAPRVVLAGIPGMTDELVDRIISERQPDPIEAEPHRRHETWILSEGIVTLDEMKALVPFVTGGGCVYRAQVIGYFDRGGPAVRIETVLDAATQPAQLVFFRDLSHLGRGYALETLGIADLAPADVASR